MSLDKGIEHGKEKRKPYRGAKAVDGTCRNHGTCVYCQRNREHRDKVRKEKMDYGLKRSEYDTAETQTERSLQRR